MRIISHIVSASVMQNGFSLKSNEELKQPDGSYAVGPTYLLGIPSREKSDGSDNGAWMDDRVLCNLIGFAVRPEDEGYSDEETDEWLASFDSDDITMEERQELNKHQVSISIWAELNNGRPNPLYEQICQLSDEADGAATTVAFSARRIAGRVREDQDSGEATGWLCRASGIKLEESVTHTTHGAVKSLVVSAQPSKHTNMTTSRSAKPATNVGSKTPQLPDGWKQHPKDSRYAYKGQTNKLISELIKEQQEEIPPIIDDAPPINEPVVTSRRTVRRKP